MNCLKAASDGRLGRRSMTATAVWLFAITAISGLAAATTYNVVPINGVAAIVGINNGVAVGPAFVWVPNGSTVQLQPPFPTTFSVPTGIGGDLVSGYAEYYLPRQEPLPVVWNRLTGNSTILDNGGAGRALATDGTHIVGESTPYDLVAGNANPTAAYWASPHAKVLYLENPYTEGTTLEYSQAAAIYGGFVVGNIRFNAALWRISGNTATSTSLAPNGFAESNALGISRGQIVGDAYNVQVNQASVLHAGLWTGLTANSFVDLSDSSETSSVAYATNGTQQVGYVSFDKSVNSNPPADHHAVVWNGNAASIQMLPLPKGHTDSIAYAIDQQGNIAGEIDGAAVEWIPVPEPISPLSLLLLTAVVALHRRKPGSY